MIKISYPYIDKFKRSYRSYLYPISRGIYLSFDKNTLEYTGIEMFYNSSYYPLEKSEKVLEKLFYLGYIESYID